ncbi:hypothetical protein B0H19DRAFT_1254229 [Mycena capillaripes]|nr:hypothetical protein B0H19DRAFT_1254229 [Mycena capillaripes]
MFHYANLQAHAVQTLHVLIPGYQFPGGARQSIGPSASATLWSTRTAATLLNVFMKRSTHKVSQSSACDTFSVFDLFELIKRALTNYHDLFCKVRHCSLYNTLLCEGFAAFTCPLYSRIVIQWSREAVIRAPPALDLASRRRPLHYNTQLRIVCTIIKSRWPTLLAAPFFIIATNLSDDLFVDDLPIPELPGPDERSRLSQAHHTAQRFLPGGQPQGKLVRHLWGAAQGGLRVHALKA